MTRWAGAVLGMAEVQAKLLEIADIGTAKKVMRQSVGFALRPLIKTAKQLAPVGKTGVLSRSIGLTVVIPSSGDIVISGGISMKKRRTVNQVVDTIAFSDGSVMDWKVKGKEGAGWRWHFAEFGTVKSAAHPFLRPAFDQHSKELVDRFKSSMERAIVRIAKKKMR